MMLAAHAECYCVMRIEDAKVLYRGYSLHGAAGNLGEGTCYGKGFDAVVAEMAAAVWAKHFRELPWVKLEVYDDATTDAP